MADVMCQFLYFILDIYLLCLNYIYFIFISNFFCYEIVFYVLKMFYNEDVFIFIVIIAYIRFAIADNILHVTFGTYCYYTFYHEVLKQLTYVLLLCIVMQQNIILVVTTLLKYNFYAMGLIVFRILLVISIGQVAQLNLDELKFLDLSARQTLFGNF